MGLIHTGRALRIEPSGPDGASACARWNFPTCCRIGSLSAYIWFTSITRTTRPMRAAVRYDDLSTTETKFHNGTGVTCRTRQINIHLGVEKPHPYPVKNHRRQTIRGEGARIDADTIGAADGPLSRRMPMDDDLSEVVFAIEKLFPDPHHVFERLIFERLARTHTGMDEMIGADLHERLQILQKPQMRVGKS